MIYSDALAIFRIASDKHSEIDLFTVSSNNANSMPHEFKVLSNKYLHKNARVLSREYKNSLKIRK